MTSRPLGRGPDELRPIFFKTKVVSQAGGSAYMEVGRTKVLCSVYGPRQKKNKEAFSEKGKLKCDYRCASFAKEDEGPPEFGRTDEERDNSFFLTEALLAAVRVEKFPKAVVDVFVLVLEDDGGALPCALTCASMALANAGIEMLDLVVGCGSALVDSVVVIDPDQEEVNKADSSVLVGYLPSLNEVAQLTQSGEMDVAKVRESIDLCTDGCAKVAKLARQVLVADVQATEA